MSSNAVVSSSFVRFKNDLFNSNEKIKDFISQEIDTVAKMIVHNHPIPSNEPINSVVSCLDRYLTIPLARILRLNPSEYTRFEMYEAQASRHFLRKKIRDSLNYVFCCSKAREMLSENQKSDTATLMKREAVNIAVKEFAEYSDKAKKISKEDGFDISVAMAPSAAAIRSTFGTNFITPQESGLSENSTFSLPLKNICGGIDNWILLLLANLEGGRLDLNSDSFENHLRSVVSSLEDGVPVSSMLLKRFGKVFKEMGFEDVSKIRFLKSPVQDTIDHMLINELNVAPYRITLCYLDKKDCKSPQEMMENLKAHSMLFLKLLNTFYFFDSNFGLKRFSNVEDAAKFLDSHMKEKYLKDSKMYGGFFQKIEFRKH